MAVEIATAVPRGGVPALSILRFERVPIHISFDALAPEKEVSARAKLSLSQLSVDVLSESEVRSMAQSTQKWIWYYQSISLS